MMGLKQRNRIIPARAGFTRIGLLHMLSRRDHPRSRGVYLTCGYEATAYQGSSPLARGLRLLELDRLRCEGIIPARAGFTADDLDIL